MVTSPRPVTQKYTLSELALKARCSTEALRQMIGTGRLVAARKGERP